MRAQLQWDPQYRTSPHLRSNQITYAAWHHSTLLCHQSRHLCDRCIYVKIQNINVETVTLHDSYIYISLGQMVSCLRAEKCLLEQASGQEKLEEGLIQNHLRYAFWALELSCSRKSQRKAVKNTGHEIVRWLKGNIEFRTHNAPLSQRSLKAGLFKGYLHINWRSLHILRNKMKKLNEGICPSIAKHKN